MATKKTEEPMNPPVEVGKQTVFDVLNGLNVNDLVEKKPVGKDSSKSLTYLSWCYAWGEIKKRYPDIQYEVKMFDGKPYIFDEDLGYMVFTEMTIEGVTHSMHLPVMNGANKAMKNKPYTIKTRYGEQTVEAATMFDINTAIMRCLTKNMAMFGLGLYIYKGEDIPETEEAPKAETPKATAPQTNPELAGDIKVKALCTLARRKGIDEERLLKNLQLRQPEARTLNEMLLATWDGLKATIEKMADVAPIGVDGQVDLGL